ncbi:unnamed protein product, partial [Polarella glacialis]
VLAEYGDLSLKTLVLKSPRQDVILQIHMRNQRVQEGRDHDALVRTITARHGFDGAPVLAVLQEMCQSRRLNCQTVSRSIAEHLVWPRVLLATFAFDAATWLRFSGFFQRDPYGILRKDNLQGVKSGPQTSHAVVIVEQTPDVWIIKNSWGADFADKGFFKVAKDTLEFRYFDVNFVISDVSPKKIKAYSRAPQILKICITRTDWPLGGPFAKNPVSKLGWIIDFTSLRVERVERRSSPIAHWNNCNPFDIVHPGYYICAVNSVEDPAAIIEHLRDDPVLQITLIISDPCKLDDVLDEDTRGYSYAHAVAGAVRNAQMRIFGRAVERHGDIVTSIVRIHGCDNIDVPKVLEDACTQRGLRCQDVDQASAANVLQNRSLIASVVLDKAAWRRLSSFFTEDPNGILTAEHLNSDADSVKQPATVMIVGHLYCIGR